MASSVPASALPPSADTKALEIKRQEFDELRRKSEALRARALKAEGEARELADRADTLEAEAAASKKKGAAHEERVEELTRLFDHSENVCRLLKKRADKVGVDYVALEETHRLVEDEYNKLKEEMKVSLSIACI